MTSKSPTQREKLVLEFLKMPDMLVCACVRFRGGGIVLRGAVKTQFDAMRVGLLATLVGIAFVSVNAQARDSVKITVSSPSQIKIQIHLGAPSQSWSFRNAYAGVLGIAERVEEFRASASDGSDAGARKIAVGEFRSNSPAKTIEYGIKLSTPSPAAVAHVSWIAGDSGFLMFADLLPENLPELFVKLTLPAGWNTYAPFEIDTNMTYHVSEPEKAVFFLGRSLRHRSMHVRGNVLEAIVHGDWPFKDEIALKAAGRVLEKYFALTGVALPWATVMIAPLPVSVGEVKWRAETRGSTVVLLLDPRAEIKNWKGQLGIIFTHELLHLWVPNALRLQGDYDWFFEGFTLYTALVTALELKLIDFKEYLATLARVYDSYLAQADGLSLIDASERRWTSGNSLVYDKGMLVAFLYDLTISRQSDGKSRLADRYRELFGRSTAAAGDGNEVIIGLLSSTPATAELARRYIKGREELDLKAVFANQKQIAKSLGYH